MNVKIDSNFPWSSKTKFPVSLKQFLPRGCSIRENLEFSENTIPRGNCFEEKSKIKGGQKEREGKKGGRYGRTETRV